jgi:hypothetical protein
MFAKEAVPQGQLELQFVDNHGNSYWMLDGKQPWRRIVGGRWELLCTRQYLLIAARYVSGSRKIRRAAGRFSISQVA